MGHPVQGLHRVSNKLCKLKVFPYLLKMYEFLFSYSKKIIVFELSQNSSFGSNMTIYFLANLVLLAINSLNLLF